MEVSQSFFGRYSFGVGGFNRVFSEFGHQDEFRHAAGGDHKRFGDEVNAEPRRFDQSHLRKHLRHKLYREYESMVVIGFKRFGVLKKNAIHYLGQNIKVREEDDEHRPMFLRLYEI